jgi:2-phospho-L-lactate guanylyltransferase
MSVWAIIPVKPLANAKSRLSGVLNPAQRYQLAEMLMRHTIGVVKPIARVAGTLVISRDPKALAIARELGAHTVQESGAPELNHALMRATQVVIGLRGEAVLILPADLPLITSEDVVGMIERGADENSMVIATDRNQDGTNAMFTRPAGLIPYAYGGGSFSRHVEAGRAIGASVHVYQSERLMLDIDMPEDLEKYVNLARAGGVMPTFMSANGA